MGFIYFTTYPAPLLSFRSLLQALPLPMQEKVLRFRRWEDAHASLLGRYLLAHGLKEHGHPEALHELQYTSFGRPFLGGGLDFNISHSGHVVVCIICPDARVGIDVERVRPLELTDFTNQFSEREWAAIHGADDPVSTFYTYWTRKEAILKADGSGLQVPLTRLEVTGTGPVFLNGEQWYLNEVKLLPDYACHVACNKAGADFTLQELKF